MAIKESSSKEHESREQREVVRFLGLSLGGAKSDRTCLTVIDCYTRQNKAFVIDVFDSIAAQHEFTADQVILQLVHEHQPGIHTLAVDAPLTLPPCLSECLNHCTGYEHCRRPEVKWMRNQYKRAKEKNSKIKHFTSYSQRPVELYFRYKFPGEDIFQDETLGANLAPQTARMQYLKRHLAKMNLIEVWPKLTLFYLMKELHLHKRDIFNYRNLENGINVREKILESLIDQSEIFIYDRDLKKFIHNIPAFDSLICAWTALQYGRNKIEKFRSDLPLESGWVTIPEL